MTIPRWRFLFVLAALPLAGARAAPGGAGPGGSTPRPSPGIPQERRVLEDVAGSPATPQRETPPSFQIEGTVRTMSGKPVAGALVKLFADGVAAAAVRTDGDGSFRIAANAPVGKDDTTVLWVESPDPDRLLDAQAVLAESEAARRLKLFPPCVQRVRFSGEGARVEIALMSPEERRAALQRSKCLEEGTG